MDRLNALINDIICSFYIFSRLSIFNTGYQVLFEDVRGSLGNMFIFCTKWIPVYTHSVTPSQEDIYRVRAFYIRWVYGYDLYLGISPEGHGME